MSHKVFGFWKSLFYRPEKVEEKVVLTKEETRKLEKEEEKKYVRKIFGLTVP